MGNNFHFSHNLNFTQIDQQKVHLKKYGWSKAMGKSKLTGKSNPSGRDPGGFIALPWSVMDCPAYSQLSMHARSLLLEVARQYVRDNNGRLLLSMAYMKTRGWKSASMLFKSKKELLDKGFIFETVRGHRPNKASWYAVTWFQLDKLKGFDPETEKCFERSAYLKNAPIHIKRLNPSHGLEKLQIRPQEGLKSISPSPYVRAIKPAFALVSRPQHGHHLDKPSTPRLNAANE
jgi:hypothetical protein